MRVSCYRCDIRIRLGFMSPFCGVVLMNHYEKLAIVFNNI